MGWVLENVIVYCVVILSSTFCFMYYDTLGHMYPVYTEHRG
jgi:hypothetical protein